ncbi:MAG: aminodeoxychorismate synthase component I [Actinomycetota bacterium]
MGDAQHISVPRHECRLESGTCGGWQRWFTDPVAVFRSKDGRSEVSWSDGRTEPSIGDPFATLDRILAEHPGLVAAGYWSYDLRHHLERLPRNCTDDLQLPDCWVGLYPAPSKQSPDDPPFPDAVPPQRPTLRVPANRSADTHPALDSVSRREYEEAVRKVLRYIGAGDCYQVNLSHRFSAPLPCTPRALYHRLRRLSPAPYAAFLDCGDHQVLSSSPELFLRVAGGLVETQPIKGTRPRSADPAEDAAAAAELLASEKDAAELLMIVDLERNDLGRVCRYGSVRVPELRRLESFANVHHLVATVQGELRPGVTPLQALRAAFPGGSITGAPKIRAMEIIEELEPYRRGVYTGAIGWVDGHGRGEWNIAIRTMVTRGDSVYFHVGGGIVADSIPAAEYEETLAKAQGMLQALRDEGDR